MVACPLPEFNPLLQPIAHALMQAREEVIVLTENFPESLLWIQTDGLASPGFHLQHLTGVLNRLFSYARAEPLTEIQLTELANEGKPVTGEYTTSYLVKRFAAEVESALAQLKLSNPEELTDYRAVGRNALPSTMLGLYVHAAEHTMRHVGQLLVTTKVLKHLHRE